MWPCVVPGTVCGAKFERGWKETWKKKISAAYLDFNCFSLASIFLNRAVSLSTVHSLQHMNKHNTHIQWNQIPLSPPPFCFDTSPESLKYNTSILAKFDFDLNKLMRHYRGSALNYVLEFRPVNVLSLIFWHHPDFEFNSARLWQTVLYIFTMELTEDKQIAASQANIIQGNHKCVSTDQIEFNKKIQKKT